eukprot:7387671-Prymnesium_polylepis.1
MPTSCGGGLSPSPNPPGMATARRRQCRWVSDDAGAGEGEGALEGQVGVYLLKSPFATAFAFSRFGAVNSALPRNRRSLGGTPR